MRSGESFYTVHATTVAQDMMLLEGQDGTSKSHIDVWISDLVLRVSRYPSLFSDSDGYLSHCGLA